MSEWADTYRVLDPMFSSEPGPWRTERTPYAREWMDSGALPWVRRMTMCCSTQVGKTEAINNLFGFYLHQRPSPSMLVMSNDDAARLAAERRILPMIRMSPALSAELTERSHDVKHREIALRRSVLYMRGAQSPTGLASVPVRFVGGDECDKWPDWTGREAAPLDLVMERTRTFVDSVVVLASTPTTRHGLIYREFLLGDQRRYHVPCPHCGTFQTLRWAQVKWDSDRIRTGNQMRVAREAWYECVACAKRIDDRAKRGMLEAGHWVPEGEDPKEWLTKRDADRNEHRSYHLWAAYSPWLTWWKIVAQFLDAKDTPSKMMNFVNCWLAELWEERVDDNTDEGIAACIEERAMFEIPNEVKVLTASVDVQKDRLEWLVQGWGMDEESWVIAAGAVQKQADEADWKELGELLFMAPWGKERPMRLRVCVVDSRYRRDEAMEFCRRWHPTTKLVAGVERVSPVPFSTTRIDKHPRTGLLLPNSVTVWTINVDLFKDLVAARIAKALTEPDAKPGRIHLPSDLPPEWINQLASEHKVRERSGSKERLRWVLKQGHQRNEAWDLMVYSAAAARLVRVDTLRSPERRTPTRPTSRSNAPTHQRRRQRPDPFPRLAR